MLAPSREASVPPCSAPAALASLGAWLRSAPRFARARDTTCARRWGGWASKGAGEPRLDIDEPAREGVRKDALGSAKETRACLEWPRPSGSCVASPRPSPATGSIHTAAVPCRLTHRRAASTRRLRRPEQEPQPEPDPEPERIPSWSGSRAGADPEFGTGTGLRLGTRGMMLPLTKPFQSDGAGPGGPPSKAPRTERGKEKERPRRVDLRWAPDGAGGDGDQPEPGRLAPRSVVPGVSFEVTLSPTFRAARPLCTSSGRRDGTPAAAQGDGGRRRGCEKNRPRREDACRSRSRSGGGAYRERAPSGFRRGDGPWVGRVCARDPRSRATAVSTLIQSSRSAMAVDTRAGARRAGECDDERGLADRGAGRVACGVRAVAIRTRCRRW